MIKLSPSILAADFSNLQRDCQQAAAGGADYIHVDLMDGHFVPNFSVGPPVVQALKRAITLPLDVHLMVDNPSQYIPELCRMGASIITVHLEGYSREEEVHQALHLIRSGGARPGLTLRPGTPLEQFLPYLEELSLALVMTVEPGFGGQALIPEMLDRVRALRKALDQVNPACELEVDGGIRLENVADAVSAGANVIVTGSAAFGGPDIPGRVRALKSKFHENHASPTGKL